MPIIKSAQKRMRQNAFAHVRNHAQDSKMRSLYKNIVKWVASGEVEKAESFFDETQKAIDTCAKKNIIHKNNADRKKARIAKLISAAKGAKKPEAKPTKVTTDTATTAVKKAPEVAKEQEPKTETES